MKKEVLFIIIFLISLYNVNAIGISPARVEIIFKPNLNYNISYLVNNNGNNDLDIEMFAKGDLNESIMLEENYAKIKPGEWKRFSAEINLPKEISPGLHVNEIVAMEALASEGMIGTRSGVGLQLYIRAPYPGKYLEGIFEVLDAKVNEPVKFKIKLTNRGKENVNSVKGVIEITQNGIAIANLNTNEIKIYVGEEKELNAEWVANTPGAYNAVAKIYYDENFLELNGNFRVGDLLIKIVNVSFNDIEEGQIAKFGVELESSWNEEIKDAYVELNIKQNEIIIDNVKSSNINLKPWERKWVDIYWDARNKEIGRYVVEIIVNYADKKESEVVYINIIEKKFKLTKPIMLLIVTAIAILTLMLLKKFVFKKRKKRKHKK